MGLTIEGSRRMCRYRQEHHAEAGEIKLPVLKVGRKTIIRRTRWNSF